VRKRSPLRQACRGAAPAAASSCTRQHTSASWCIRQHTLLRSCCVCTKMRTYACRGSPSCSIFRTSRTYADVCTKMRTYACRTRPSLSLQHTGLLNGERKVVEWALEEVHEQASTHTVRSRAFLSKSQRLHELATYRCPNEEGGSLKALLRRLA